MARDIPDLPGFNLFWDAWPGNIAGGYARKGGKAECLKLWRKMGLETSTEEILRHIAYLKTTRQWRDTFGDYIPAPAVHLRQRRWDGADIPDPSAPMPTQPAPADRKSRQLMTAGLMTGSAVAAMPEAIDVYARRIDT